MKPLFFALCAFVFVFSNCKKDQRQPDLTYNPEIKPENFSNSTILSNPHFAMEMGKTYVSEGQSEEGKEHNEVKLTGETKVIQGITCIVVNDKVWLEGVLIEDTDDWFAQDNEGNVWYFGEAVDNYNNDGSFADHHGAWEAGVDGAKAGIVMPANPQVGIKFRQEYYFGEAEDQAEILETGLSVTVPFGTFTNCIKTHEWTELEPDVNENKFFAPGVGLIKTVNVTDKEEYSLINIIE